MLKLHGCISRYTVFELNKISRYTEWNTTENEDSENNVRDRQDVEIQNIRDVQNPL